ncbi:MAG: hypothetical protein Q8910_17615 [Bacteroidota bacterium]|nr:hypothetical protein [Bacteroidota bacterium]
MKRFVVSDNMIIKKGLPGKISMDFTGLYGAYPFILIYNNPNVSGFHFCEAGGSFGWDDGGRNFSKITFPVICANGYKIQAI